MTRNDHVDPREIATDAVLNAALARLRRLSKPAPVD
jgi:hypothetical protein